MKFDSHMRVTPIDHMGDDLSIVAAARVSLLGNKVTTVDHSERLGLIEFLLRERHTSPFEHVTATFLIDVPIFVAREWHRHRTQSYNEVSGRYKELEPRFYVPGVLRPLTQVGKPGAYSFNPGSAEQHELVTDTIRGNCYDAWSRYQGLLEAGVAREVARDVLPVNIFTQFYATANLLNWFRFLTLRTAPQALYEIREAADKVHAGLATICPVAVEVWERT